MSTVRHLAIYHHAPMLKLYKDVAGSLHYHEAWVTDRTIYEHWGVVGERGQTNEHTLAAEQAEEDAVLAVLRPAIEDGFHPIDLEDHATLLIEYPIESMGTPHDLGKRHALEDRMNQTLGWTDLGVCDGGSIGSGTMEVCCFVVDFEVARGVIESDLSGTEFTGFSRIYDEDA
jgi:hypothetical protein